MNVVLAFFFLIFSFPDLPFSLFTPLEWTEEESAFNRKPRTFRKLILVNTLLHQLPSSLTPHEVTYLLILTLVVQVPSHQHHKLNHNLVRFVLISLLSLLRQGCA